MFGRRDIRQLYLKTTIRIKDFLLTEKSREFFVFLFFFFVAAGFWLLQTLNNDYETEFSVPVKLRGIPDNVVLISEPASEVHVKVKDKGTVLLNYMLGKSFYPVTIDFADYATDRDGVVQIHSSQYKMKVQNQLKSSTRLLSIVPDTLEYVYSKGAAKRVPVRLNGELKAGRQYYFPDTIFRPDSVDVFATQEVLDTITAAYTRWLQLADVADTLVRHVALASGKGVKFVPAAIEMTLPVDIYTEKTVEVPLVGVGFPPDKVLRTFPSKVKVTFQVGVGHFRQVTEDDFRIDVPYEELLRLGTDKYEVRLSQIPAGVNRVRFSPSQVDFLIEQLTYE